ncbi:hypothetical protein NDU88_008336 [Pleurodeles waltl]|uniref:Uncharacterized protein n=1 Tax=Pleurodeles waltl TaxID=8319 RepID=A0AAV7QU87_PLEWA|nr:hypothetical protein NDU88_008336 [Pleurodeles waltl]
MQSGGNTAADVRALRGGAKGVQQPYLEENNERRRGIRERWGTPEEELGQTNRGAGRMKRQRECHSRCTDRLSTG